jgi:hemolysin activation/secretion protein
MKIPKRKELSRAEKMSATCAAKRNRREGQTIVIDENWRIVRADELNWEVQFNGKFNGYSGSLKNAFNGLLKKMISDSARKDVAEVLKRIEEIEKKIEAKL